MWCIHTKIQTYPFFPYVVPCHSYIQDHLSLGLRLLHQPNLKAKRMKQNGNSVSQ